MPSDADLLRRSLKDPAAFELIFDRYYDQILRFARHRTGHDVGEDLAARTFEIGFLTRERFDQRYPSARPWLFGICANLIRHHWRDEQTHLLSLQRLPIDPDVEAADDPARVHAALVAPLVLAAIAELGPADRETFLLAALTDATYAEIATSLGIPVGTVRSRISRVRKLLRERLGSFEAITAEADDDG